MESRAELTVLVDTNGALILEDGGDDDREVPVSAVWLATRAACSVLPLAGLPTTGWVDLNRDPAKRWGVRSSTRGTPSRFGIWNLGMRVLRGGGVLPGGTPWLLYETESRNAAREASTSDLYLSVDGAWVPSATTTPRGGVSQLWELAAPGPGNEITLFERHVGGASVQSRIAVRRWRAGQLEPLYELSGKLPRERNVDVLTRDDGRFVAAGASTTEPTAAAAPFRLWFLSPGHGDIRAATFDGVQIPPFHARKRATEWGIHFDSVDDLVLWRRGQMRWRFRYDAAVGNWTHAAEPLPTVEERIVDQLAGDGSRRIVSVKTTSEGTSWVVVAAGSLQQLLTDAPAPLRCPTIGTIAPEAP